MEPSTDEESSYPHQQGLPDIFEFHNNIPINSNSFLDSVTTLMLINEALSCMFPKSQPGSQIFDHQHLANSI